MKILFIARRYLYFRNFESVIRELARRGHQLHLAVERDDTEGRPALVDALLADFPNNITCGYAPTRGDDDWAWMASRLRLGLDYLRYQHPLFDDTPKLTDRARERAPGLFVAVGKAIRGGAAWARRPAIGLVRALERGIPEDLEIRRFIEGSRPDVVLITPLIDVGSWQIEYLRSARSLGIPTAMCVWSWDHLSSKALIRECPDRVFVWNETQKREAIELHGVEPDRIVVTGAQCFDQWFDRQPSRDRDTFCRAMGLAPSGVEELPANRALLLYVCSAPFLGSPPEAPFVLEWIRRVREAGAPALRDAAILVRPHPSRTREWQGVDVSRFGGVAIRGGSPVDGASRSDYFDALYHSAAVVGLNTSAFIEAGIVGRPVHTILLPEWYENQRGTLHFRYLLEVSGGLLIAAHDFDEHLRQLAESLAGSSKDARPFVRAFVRPHGLDVAATPLFVRGVAEMSGTVPLAARPVTKALRRRALAGLLRLRHRRHVERWLYSQRELEVMERDRRAEEATLQREAELRARSRVAKETKQAERQRDWERHRAMRAAQDAQKKAMRS